MPFDPDERIPDDDSPAPADEEVRRSGPPHLGALVKGLLVAGTLTVFTVLLIALPAMYFLNERAEQERQRQAEEAERIRLENERSAELERKADEERREREEAERKAAEAAAAARREAEIEATAAVLGVKPVAAEIVNDRTLQKLLHAQRFGSHWLYMFEDVWGRASVEQIGDVYFFNGSNERPGASVTLRGVVTEISDGYVTLDGTVSVRFEDDPPCGWSGKHRLALAAHPNYFRAQVSCEGRHHYLDLFVDDAWMTENPE